tara:strand:+ start:926 stop:1150 length:225 start_codon:yes stop_codon:yes gene_type:complete
MGEIKEKPKTEVKPKPIPKSKVVEEVKDKVKNETNIKKLREDLDKLGNWIADVDDELGQVIDLVNRMATRLGME